jgi:membrane fusion protein (multidrug efflux system)
MQSEGEDTDMETLELDQTPAAQPAARKTEETPRPNGKRKILLLGGAALLLVLLTILYFYYRNRVSTDDAQIESHVTPVSSKIYGSVAEVLVLDNTQVKAGQVLVRIDPRDYEAKVEQARAALALAESQAKGAASVVPMTAATTNSGISAAEADVERARLAYQEATTATIALAQANVAKSQASYDKAKADLNRMKPLADKAEISQQEYDGYVEAANVAQGQLDADKQKLEQAQQNIPIAKANLDAAEAHLADARANSGQVSIRSSDASAASAGVLAAQADLDSAELQLSYANIVAPVDGYVTHKSVEVGEIVQPGQGLLVVVPLNDVWVTANFKETQLANVRPGQRVEVDVDMYGRTFGGHVDSIAGATGARLSLFPPENATGNFVKVVQRIPVKILLDPIPPDQAILRPGMNVSVTILTN